MYGGDLETLTGLSRSPIPVPTQKGAGWRKKGTSAPSEEPSRLQPELARLRPDRVAWPCELLRGACTRNIEREVCIGDRYRIGGALFEVTQPRVTCYRIGIRMNESRMAALLTAHGRPGFYFRVLEEGEVRDWRRSLRARHQKDGKPPERPARHTRRMG